MKGIAILALWSIATLAWSSSFNVIRLPQGKDVTLPRPATTLVPMNERVLLTATDRPQTISFSVVNIRNPKLAPIKVAVFNPKRERVQYLLVEPKKTVLYTFDELNSVFVIPKLPLESAKPGIAGGVRLKIESDKPLQIAR